MGKRLDVDPVLLVDGDPAEIEEKLRELAAKLEDFIAQQKKVVDASEDLRKKHDPSPDEVALFENLPKPKKARKKKAPKKGSTASTAADILGSESGVLDRGDALEEGMGTKRD